MGPSGARSVDTRLRWLTLAFAAALTLVSAAGCGGESATGSAELSVSRDFGHRVMKPRATSSLRPGATAMRQLQRAAKVETAYGGRFVASIDGARQDTSAGYDWLFYVDGEEPDIGAAQWRLKPGQVVQWDLHRWTAVSTGAAIVGAFPRPFTTRGARLLCTLSATAACDEVRTRLDSAGVRESESANAVPLLVGPWHELAELADAPALERDAAKNGAFSQFTAKRLDVVDQTGRIGRSLSAGSGLIAALREGSKLRWIVAGVDAPGAKRAAETLTAEALGGLFAVAVPPAGEPLALPLQDAGPGG